MNVARGGLRSGPATSLGALAVVAAVMLAIASTSSPPLGAAVIAVVATSVAATQSHVRLSTLVLAAVVLYRGLQGALAREMVVPATVPLLVDLASISVVALAVGRAAVGTARVTRGGIAFVLLAILSLLNPMVPDLGFGMAGLRALVLPVLLGMAVSLLDFSARERQLLWMSLILVLAANSLLVLRQVVVGFTPAEVAALQANVSTYDVRGAFRPLGALLSNQDLGLLLALGLPFLTATAVRADGRLRTIFALMSFVAGIALLTTLLRSAMLAGALGVAVALVSGRAKEALSRRLVRTVAVGMILAASALLVLQSGILGERGVAVIDRLETVTQLGADRSFNDRVEGTLPAAYAAFARYPLGAGPGSAGPVSQALPNVAPLGPLTPDNGYLLIGIQLGLAGLLLAVSLLFRIYATTISDQPGAAGAAVALAAAMLFGGYWSLVGPATLFFVAVALAGGLRRVNTRA